MIAFIWLIKWCKRWFITFFFLFSFTTTLVQVCFCIQAFWLDLNLAKVFMLTKTSRKEKRKTSRPYEPDFHHFQDLGFPLYHVEKMNATTTTTTYTMCTFACNINLLQSWEFTYILTSRVNLNLFLAKIIRTTLNYFAYLQHG